jgi:glycosidase
VPEGWRITPWTHDWYKHDPYFDQVKGSIDMAGDTIESFGQLSRLRRYGGDLQGVLDKIGYLDSLGITAVYFNPLNDAPSDHKFDARNWRHIDRNFGPSPEEDARIMASEIPDDPETWQMTGADRMFVDLVARLHEHGIRVIMDYSWNHTGTEFWAWKDLVRNQTNSEYAEWYWVKQFDDPQTPENEFDYRGWFGVKDLAEIKETEYMNHQAYSRAFEGNIASEAVKQHIFSVTRKWLDPDGDGNPSDGVDGFRLDVCAEVPLGFWREYRKVVRDLKPDAYLVGEIWFERYPNTMMDPEPFLKGDVFDGVMNYRWYKAAREFFIGSSQAIKPSAFVDSLERISGNLRRQNNYAMMNVAASHDSPRLSTSLFNRQNRYKYRVSPTPDMDYKIHKPDEEAYQTQRLLLVHQYTYIGAPHIWAGDEMGMWGADMGDARKPVIWPDYDFEPEVVHPFEKIRPEDEVKFNYSLFRQYQKLIKIRNENPVLVNGNIEYVLIDDENELLAYSRFDEKDEVLAVFNTGRKKQSIRLPVRTNKKYRDVLSDQQVIMNADHTTEMNLPARCVAILIAE